TKMKSHLTEDQRSSEGQSRWPNPDSPLRGLRSPVLRLDVLDVLGEGPEVALEVVGVVPAVAVLLVPELATDLRAGGFGPLEVRVDVVDVHVDLDRDRAHPLRVPVGVP